MQTRCVRRSLLAHGHGLVLHFLALGALLLASPASAQQDEAGQAMDMQTVNSSIVAENPGAADLSLQQDQAYSSSRSSLPNAPSSSWARYSQPGSLTLGERFNIYRRSIFRPYTAVGPALGAGIGQWEDEPPEWGQGANGYAHRFASGMGRHLIAETVRFAVAAADGEGPRHHRSEESGVWARARHAIAETFTSQTASGKRIPAFSRFAGSYGAAFVSNLWYPDSRATAGWAMRRGSTALGSSLGFHLFEEFVPRKYFNALHLQD